jgi:trk system potassium uptake protein
MRVGIVLVIVGQLQRSFALVFLAPLLQALWDGHWRSAIYFSLTATTAVLTSLATIRIKPNTFTLYRAEAFAVVALAWADVAFWGAIPYVLYGVDPVDALFESMSGFTTTGATILADFLRYDRAFFLWRSMTQWFGGLGVIALFVVVLPRLGIAGRQLFFAEASTAPTEAVSPQVRHTARRLWIVYAALTLAMTALLVWVADFSWFDAANHALTTLAAGGFSPNPASLAGYQNAKAEWIVTVFMVLGGTNFVLQYKVITGRVLGFFRDNEFAMYIGVMGALSLGVAIDLSNGLPSSDSLRTGAFQVASLMSSTGFASVDYNLWPDSSRCLLILAMLVGGCAGSAAGGPKVVRLLLVVKHVLREMTFALHPRAVMPLRYNGKPVSRDIIRSVFTLVALYMLSHFFVGTALVLMGSDLVVGYTAALACIGNVGPGLGSTGPMGSFAGFSPVAKLLLTASMWIGRLEIVTVLALLHPHVWRRLGWFD